MKKFTLSLFLMLLIFSTISSGAFADSPNSKDITPKVIFEAKEITNLEVLEEKAINGISDNKAFPSSLSEGEIISVESEEPYQLETVQTTQKLKSVQTTDEVVDSYATTFFTYVEDKEKSKEKELGLTDSFLNIIAGFISPKKVSAGSKYDYTNGASSAVKSYSTIYWDTRISGTTT